GMDREAAVDPAGDDGPLFELGAEASGDGKPPLVVHRVPKLAGEHCSRFPARLLRPERFDGPAETAGPASFARGPGSPSDHRLLILVEAKPVQVYDVECLFPDRKLPIPLGDLDSAMPICNACTAAQIFRADEE